MANPFIYALTDTRWSNAATAYNAIWMDVNNGSGGSAVGLSTSRLLKLTNNTAEVFGINLAGTVVAGTWQGTTVAVGFGGTGQTSYTDGQLLIGNTATGLLSKATLTQGSNITITNGNGTITIAASGGSGTVTSVAQTFTGGLISVAGSPVTTSGTLALTVAGTSGGIPYFSGATTWASSALLAANAIMIGGGAGAAPATTITGTGVLTAIGNNVNSANGLATVNVATLSSLTSIGTIGAGVWQGTVITVTFGGTGRATLTNHGVLVGAGTGAITQLSAAAAGTVLTGQGASADPSFSATPTFGVQQTTQGQLILANTAAGAFPTTIQSSNSASAAWTLTLPVTAGTNGYILSTDGAGVTSWIANSGGGGTVTSVAQTFTGGIISVAGSPITGSGTLALTVAGTSGGIPYFSSTSAWASSALLAANAIMIGGGAGAAPATTTTGTGVLTAISNNVNSANGLATVNVTTLSSLVSVGTITTGVWTGTTIAVANGGTGATTLTAHGLLLGQGTSAITALALPAAGTILQGAAAADPSWTATPTLGVQQTTQGSLILANTAAGAFSTTIKSSNSASAAWTLTLPTTAGTNLFVLQTDGSGNTSWVAQSGGGGSPGGSNTQVQFNNSSAFGGSANLTWVSPALTIGVASTTAGQLVLANTSANSVTLQSSNSTSAAWTMTLPVSAGTNGYTLTTNGSGVTSWTAPGAASLTVGSSAIASGTSGRLLYDNAAVLGETAGITTDGTNLTLGSTSQLLWSTDLILTRAAAATIQMGAADGATATAQTFQVQSVASTNSNVSGADYTFIASRPTGTGTSGNIIYQTSFKGVTTSATCTFSNGSANVTSASHGFVPGQVVQFTTTGALPTNFATSTNYFVISTGLTSSVFQVSTTAGGSAVTAGSAGSGTQTVTAQTNVQNPASTLATWGPSGLTGSQTTAALSIAPYWNTSGVPTALDINVTIIAAGSAPKLLNLRSSGTTQWNCDRFGNTIQVGGIFTGAGSNSITVGYVGANIVSVGRTAGSIGFGTSPGSNAGDALLTSPAAAIWQLGAADINGSAVAQTFQPQSAVTGTDKAAADFTIRGSRQTGAGTTGKIIFQTSPALASGTTQGSYATALTLTAPAVNMQPSVVVGNQAVATNATDGFFYTTTCAGTPTGVPTTFTGRVALVYDTTNHQLWVYDGGWLQPKTPAAAATVTWQ